MHTSEITFLALIPWAGGFENRSQTEKTVRLEIRPPLELNNAPNGTINTIWDYQHHLGLSTPFETINTIWDYQHHLGLSTPFVTINTIWDYQHHLGLSTPFGTINTIWDYQHHITSSSEFLEESEEIFLSSSLASCGSPEF